MDNVILSSKVGDKWTKVTSDMTSVKLGTCIHIVGKLSSGYSLSEGDFYEERKGGETSRKRMIYFDREFTVIPKHTQLSSQ
jgi:hypothetical protein